MSAGDGVRSKIEVVEAANQSAGTDNAINAIVEALKEIARALDERTETPNPPRELGA